MSERNILFKQGVSGKASVAGGRASCKRPSSRGKKPASKSEPSTLGEGWSKGSVGVFV